MTYIVCGFYTPDYAEWSARLRLGLNRHGIPHDLAQVEKDAGGWEANTRLKAREVLRACRRHPVKTIVFLDVDCEVRGDLAPLADAIRGDIGIYFCVKRRAKGARVRVRSGTLVIRQTPQAHRFLEAWVAHCASARVGDNDQTCFVAALSGATGVTLEPLDRRWCVAPGDDDDAGVPADAVIVHDSASQHLKRMSKLEQFTRRLLRRAA
jgi:hypothetical protein